MRGAAVTRRGVPMIAAALVLAALVSAAGIPEPWPSSPATVEAVAVADQAAVRTVEAPGLRPTAGHVAPVEGPVAGSTAGAGPVAGAAAAWPSSAEATIEELIGQKLVVRVDGRTAGAGLRRRIRRGEIGGVVLFGFNVASRSQLSALTAELQAAAAAGGRPPLLIMVDQEGGAIRTVPWAPPTLSARQMGVDGRSETAGDQGAAAARALRRRGVNVDLAPVADVPSSTASFMYLAGRTFAFGPRKVGRLAGAFADGLGSERIVAAVKHFPGIGRARRNTDRNAVTIRASRSSLDTDLAPFRKAISRGIPVVMLSNAIYTAWDERNAAGWSRAISVDLLRAELGFTGVTITDSLSGTAVARGTSGRRLAVRAARAGTDMVMLTSKEAATAEAFDLLVAKARAGALPLDRLRASYDRILALKSGL